jgi:hypothetical protein
MDHILKFITANGSKDNDDYAENIRNGPTIGIFPGQVKEDVHYMESKGSIDLSYLRFYADNNAKHTHTAFSFDLQSNKANDEKEESHIDNNKFNGSVAIIESFVDIAVFEVPQHCTSQNCDLSKVRHMRMLLLLLVSIPYE